MVHLTQDQLFEQLEEVRSKIMVGGLYCHYKNPDHLYVVEFVGLLENSEEACVGYRAVYGKGILWVRTAEDFLMEVEVQDKRITRFVLLKEK
jgi:hypothetical protein